MPEPDRKRAIDDFLFELTPSELYYAKHTTVTIIRRTARGLEGLPLEVVSIISQYLGAHDVCNLQRVSKLWRSVWGHPVVSSALCRRMFPGYIEFHAGKDPSIGRTPLLLQGLREATQLLPSASEFDAILCGSLESDSVWRFDLGDDHLGWDPGYGFCEPVLKQGKFAWSMGDAKGTAHVHDLASGHVQSLQFESTRLHNGILLVRAVSSKLLVVTMNSRLRAEPNGGFRVHDAESM